MKFNPSNGFTPQEIAFVKRFINGLKSDLTGLIVTEHSTDATKAYSTTYINSMLGEIETALISLRGVITNGNNRSVARARSRQK